MVQTIRIEERLPGLNEYINACRTNKYKAAKLKEDTEYMIQLYARNCEAVKNYPVTISFEWHELNHKRDLDNIYSAKKFVLDALQKCGVLRGDGQKYVAKLKDDFVKDDWCGCIVRIAEVN